MCTGAQSIPDAQDAIQLVVATLRTRDILVSEDPAIVVQNIVSSADHGHQLNLNAIAFGLGLETVEYEPEQFPGLVYRMGTPAVIVLLFGSGKLVIAGGQTPDDTAAAVDSVGAQLAECGCYDEWDCAVCQPEKVAIFIIRDDHTTHT